MDGWKKSMRNAYSRKPEKDVINKVLMIKQILDHDERITRTGYPWALFNHLLQLEVMGLSSKVLHTTGIAFFVVRFRNHPHKPVQEIVSAIMEQWRVVTEGLEKKNQDVVNSNPATQKPTPKMKPTNLIKPMNESVKRKLEAEPSCIEQKIEETKKKLQQDYQKTENIKKRRRIQVIEFHELGKHGLLPQKQCGQIKIVSKQFRRWGNQAPTNVY